MLDMCLYPNPILRTRCEPVTCIDSELRTLIDQMFETMYGCGNGVGLAAPQVGVNTRVVVIDVSPERNQPMALINPVITKKSGREEAEEGCLSLPELNGHVVRAAIVTVEAQAPDGSDITIEADGLLARCLQHEVDHLNGVLFIDKIAQSEKMALRDELAMLEYKFARKNTPA